MLATSMSVTTANADNADNGEHDFCLSNASMTQIFFVAKKSGYPLSDLGSVIDSRNTRYFATHAYDLPMSYTEKQAYNSGYNLCMSVVDTLIDLY